MFKDISMTDDEVKRIVKAVPIRFWKYNPDGGNYNEYLTAEFGNNPKCDVFFMCMKAEPGKRSSYGIRDPSVTIRLEDKPNTGLIFGNRVSDDELIGLYIEIRDQTAEYQKKFVNMSFQEALIEGGLERSIAEQLVRRK